MKPEFTKKPEFMHLAAREKSNQFTLFQEILNFFVVFLIATIAISLIGSIPMMFWFLSGERAATILAAGVNPNAMLEAFFRLYEQLPPAMTALIIALSGLLGVAAILYCRRFERRSVKSMGLTGPHALPSWLLGALLGALSFSAVAGMASAFGGISISGLRPLEGLLPTVALLFVAFVLESFGEELLVRGYLMVSLSVRQRLAASVALSSIVFGMLEVSNIGLQPLAYINVVLLGVVLALLVLLSGNLWSACGYHALWDFFRSCVFGLSDAEAEAEESLLQVSVTGHSSLLTGGYYGLTASLSATFVLLASIGILVFLLSRRTPDPVEPADADSME